MKRLALLSLCAIAACSDPAPAVSEQADELVDLDPGTLGIDIGRDGVILDHVHELASQIPARKTDYPRTPADMSLALQATVWQLNYERTLACLRGYLPNLSCGDPFVPSWVNEKPGIVHSIATLRAREQELGEHVVKFWDAACAEAQTRLKEDDWRPYCSVE